MSLFNKDIAVAYIDVDLASSTRDCLKYLYPRMVANGILFSQDGHLPLVLDVFKDNDFWEREVGAKRPEILGFGVEKLISIVRPAPSMKANAEH